MVETLATIMGRLTGSAEERLLRALGRKEIELAVMRDALDAVLLYHSGEPWHGQTSERWTQLTGETQATAKSLCDAVRRALGRA